MKDMEKKRFEEKAREIICQWRANEGTESEYSITEAFAKALKEFYEKGCRTGYEIGFENGFYDPR